MTDDNGAPAVESLEQTVGPVQHRWRHRGHRGVQVDDDKVHPAGAEQLVVVQVIASVMTAVVSAAGEARHPEILFKEIRSRATHLVAVANDHAVWDARRRAFQDAHRCICNLPFASTTVIGCIPQVVDENNIACDLVVHHPLGLGFENEIATRIHCVELRVRQGDDGEIRPGRSLWFAKEGDCQAIGLRVGDLH